MPSLWEWVLPQVSIRKGKNVGVLGCASQVQRLPPQIQAPSPKAENWAQAYRSTMSVPARGDGGLTITRPPHQAPELRQWIGAGARIIAISYNRLQRFASAVRGAFLFI